MSTIVGAALAVIVAAKTAPTNIKRLLIDYLLNTPLAQDYIRKGEINKLKELMKDSREQGMQTFDQSLYDLYMAGKISYDDALNSADSRNEVRLMIKLSSENTGNFGDDDMQLSETN